MIGALLELLASVVSFLTGGERGGRYRDASSPKPAPRPSPQTSVRIPPDLVPRFSLELLVADDPSPLEPDAVEALALDLGVETAMLWAFLDVETGPWAGFTTAGRPIIRFEPHVFERLTSAKFSVSHPQLSRPYAKRDHYPTPAINERWIKQMRPAYALDPDAALKSASWGRPQIMGFNHASCGFPTVRGFVRHMARSEAAQMECMARYLRQNDFIDAMRERSFYLIAAKYNGPANVDIYGPKLQSAYDKRIRSLEA